MDSAIYKTTKGNHTMSNTFEFCFLDALIGNLQTVRFDRYDARPLDPMPDGAVLKARDIAKPAEAKYCKWNGTQLEAMTEEERTARDAYDAAQAEASEAARQAAKPDALKGAENNFYLLCNAVFGDFQKRTFAELNAAIEAIKATDFSAAVELSVRLLAVDAEAKREGGLKWWDDAVQHD